MDTSFDNFSTRIRYYLDYNEKFYCNRRYSFQPRSVCCSRNRFWIRVCSCVVKFNQKKNFLLNTIFRMVFVKLWIQFIIVISIVGGLAGLFRFFDEIDSINSTYSIFDALIISVLGIPRRLYLDLPLITLIAIATGFGSMVRTNELLVIQSCGIEAKRLIFYAILSMSPILAGSLFYGEYGFSLIETFSNKIGRNKLNDDSVRFAWTKEDDGFVRFSVMPDGRVSSVIIYKLSYETGLLERLESENVNIIAGQLAFFDADRLEFSENQVEFNKAEGEIAARVTGDQAVWLAGDIATLGLSMIFAAAKYRDSVNLNNYRHWLIFFERLFLPITLVIMICMGASIFLTSFVRGSMSTSIVQLILVGLFYKIVSDFMTPLSELLGLYPMLGAIAPLSIPLFFMRWLFSQSS